MRADGKGLGMELCAPLAEQVRGWRLESAKESQNHSVVWRQAHALLETRYGPPSKIWSSYVKLETQRLGTEPSPPLPVYHILRIIEHRDSESPIPLSLYFPTRSSPNPKIQYIPLPLSPSPPLAKHMYCTSGPSTTVSALPPPTAWREMKQGLEIGIGVTMYADIARTTPHGG